MAKPKRNKISGKLTRALVNLSLMLFSVLILLVLFESYLRIFGYEGEGSRIKVKFDNRLGTIYESSWLHNVDFDNLPRSYQFRDQTVLTDKGDKKRILFIGDSGTFGTNVSALETYPYQFASILKKSSIDIVNAGIVGMTTIGEYNLLKDKLLALKPDVVVLGLFMANDINFNLLHTQTILKPNKWLTRIEQLANYSATVHFLYLKTIVLNDKFDFLESTNSTFTFSSKDEFGFPLLGYVDGEVALYLKQYSPTVNKAFDLLREMFIKFRDTSKKHDFQFVVAMIPTSSTTLQELKMFKPHFEKRIFDAGLDKLANDLDFDKPYERTLKICRELGMICVDIREEVRKVKEKAFVPLDDHLSPAGHRILAEKLTTRFDVDKLKFK